MTPEDLNRQGGQQTGPRRFPLLATLASVLLVISGLLWRNRTHDDPPTLPSQIAVTPKSTEEQIEEAQAASAQAPVKRGMLGAWVEDRTGLLGLLDQAKQHRAPAKSRWAYVFGSATLFAFMLLVVTGVALALVYQPDSTTAFGSLQAIDAHPLWRTLRGLHYFGASAMVVMIGVHMVRVYLFASYKYPREVSWLTGVALLFLTLAMAFTGQVLRWDQNGLWSVVVGAEQASRAPVVGRALARFLLGGDTVNGATVSHTFSLHTLWFPALIFALIGLHLYLVFKNGVSEPPVRGKLVDPATYKAEYQRVLKTDGVLFWPTAAWRDVLFSSVLILLVAGLAYWLGPPAVTTPPDPTIVQADPKPDWYLTWYFTVLALWPYGVTNAMIILAPLMAIVALLAVPFIRNRGERHPARRPWAVGIVLAVVCTIAALTVVGNREPWLPRFAAKPLPASVVASSQRSVQLGAALFHDQSCESCHQISGYGGIRGPNLTDVGARLTRGEMAWRIQNGAQSMPPYAGLLSTEALNHILDFLQTRKTR